MIYLYIDQIDHELLEVCVRGKEAFLAQVNNYQLLVK